MEKRIYYETCSAFWQTKPREGRSSGRCNLSHVCLPVWGRDTGGWQWRVTHALNGENDRTELSHFSAALTGGDDLRSRGRLQSAALARRHRKTGVKASVTAAALSPHSRGGRTPRPASS